MDELDADGGLLWGPQTRRQQKRDNVQFVPYRDFRQSGSRLSREVLYELPGQVISHFYGKGIKPKPPKKAVLNRDYSRVSGVPTYGTTFQGISPQQA